MASLYPSVVDLQSVSKCTWTGGGWEKVNHIYGVGKYSPTSSCWQLVKYLPSKLFFLNYLRQNIVGACSHKTSAGGACLFTCMVPFSGGSTEAACIHCNLCSCQNDRFVKKKMQLLVLPKQNPPAEITFLMPYLIRHFKVLLQLPLEASG